MSSSGSRGRGYPKSRGGNRPEQPFISQKSQQQSSNQDRRSQTASPENQRSEQPVHSNESSRKFERNDPSGAHPGSYHKNSRPGFRSGNSRGIRSFTVSKPEHRSDHYNPREKSSERNSDRSSTSSVSKIGNEESKINLQSPARVHVETKSGAFNCEEVLPDVKKENRRDHDATKNRSGGKGSKDQRRHSKDSSFLTEIEDDLFTAPDDVSLVHCVGADFRMGSGIAVKFREKFGSVGQLLDQRAGRGGLAHICRDQRYIFYLVTKQASKDKPTYDTMKQSLIALHDQCKKLRVTKLAMPRIGCGLDGLLWENVKKMLLEIFADGFTITIYNLEVDPACGSKNALKSFVRNEKLYLKDILQGTGLLYLCPADVSVTAEMESINEKYPFLRHLKSLKKLPRRLGTTFFSKVEDDKVFGLICKESADSPLNYEHLESALADLNRLNKNNEFEYFGIQAFEDKGDAYVMEKIDTLLRNFPGDAEFWICWPPALECMCPPEPERAQDNMEVEESQQVPVAVQKSEFTHESNSIKSTELKNVDKQYRKSTAKVGENITTESRTGVHESWEDNINPDVPIVKVNDVPNSNESDWFANNASEQVDNSEDSSPCDESGSMTKKKDTVSFEDHADTERRKSKEKKEATKMMRQKEKQERRSGGPKSCVTEIPGDLFDADNSICLAHCVGADFRMGSGIAVLFRQKFGSVPDLLQQRVNQGGVAFLQHRNRYIFYLVTKKESTGKPTYDTLRNSLHALHNKCKSLNVTELAMPRIGCGLDRLSWSQVRPMIEDIFSDGFSIKVYNLEKPGYYKNQPSGLLQEMQRTLESLASKVSEMDDKLEKTIDSGEKNTQTEVNQISLEMSELRQTIQVLVTKIENWEPQRICERLEIVERKLIEQDAENQSLKKMIENLQQQLQRQETIVPVPSFSSYGHGHGQSRRSQKSNGGHPRFNYTDEPPPLVSNLTPAQVYTGHTGMYYPSGLPIYPSLDNGMGKSYEYPSPASYLNSNHCMFATENFSAEKAALSRAAKDAARSHGHKVMEINGNIFVTKSDNSQSLSITGYDDLKTLENW